MNFFWNFLFKNMNSTYEFTLKEGPKVKMRNFWRTKSWRKILKGLKQKVDIFIGTKNIFNHLLIFETRIVIHNTTIPYKKVKQCDIKQSKKQWTLQREGADNKLTCK